MKMFQLVQLDPLDRQVHVDQPDHLDHRAAQLQLEQPDPLGRLEPLDSQANPDPPVQLQVKERMVQRVQRVRPD